MPVIRRALSSYPEVVRAIGDRHINYNQELAYVRQREAGKYAYVIRPEGDLDIGRIEHDKHKIRTVYKEGRRLARRHLSAIRRFLAAAKTESGSTSGSIIRNAPSEERAAIELLQTPVEEVPDFTDTAPVEKDKAEASGGSPDESSDESSENTFILRSSRGNRSGKKWKPGKMTSLKSKCNQDSSSDPD